jgi:DNA-nicking Smr family endonuclease
MLYIERMAKDLDLFKAAMAGVTPLKTDRPAKRAVAKPKAEKPATPKARSLPSARSTKATFVAPRIEPFDRDVDRALARGRRAPEATLDLHGMTLAEAERAVAHFLAEGVSQGHRVVLIVTGKGLRLDVGRVLGGRIRAEFPGWLERAENRARVAGFKAAHLRHGGGGAFYVLLRRRMQRG